MNKRDKALLKLMSVIATELCVIAANQAFSNADKVTTGARRTNAYVDIAKQLKVNVDKIDSIIKEAFDEQY